MTSVDLEKTTSELLVNIVRSRSAFFDILNYMEEFSGWERREPREFKK